MKLAVLIHATVKFFTNNGPAFAVIGLYTGIVVSYIDAI
jgi:hypothetical protein